jgi:hypothetical protein
MSFKEFDTVVMKAAMPSHGLKSGDVGAVVQVYSADAIEVEFVTATNLRCSGTVGNDRGGTELSRNLNSTIVPF